MQFYISSSRSDKFIPALKQEADHICSEVRFKYVANWFITNDFFFNMAPLKYPWYSACGEKKYNDDKGNHELKGMEFIKRTFLIFLVKV